MCRAAYNAYHPVEGTKGGKGPTVLLAMCWESLKAWQRRNPGHSHASDVHHRRSGRLGDLHGRAWIKVLCCRRRTVFAHRREDARAEQNRKRRIGTSAHPQRHARHQHRRIRILENRSNVALLWPEHQQRRSAACQEHVVSAFGSNASRPSNGYRNGKSQPASRVSPCAPPRRLGGGPGICLRLFRGGHASTSPPGSMRKNSGMLARVTCTSCMTRTCRAHTSRL